MGKLTSGQIAQVASRLLSEKQITLADVAERGLVYRGNPIQPSARELLRWGQTGSDGVHLDIIYCRKRRVWVTSREALGRFLRAVREKR